MKKKIRNLFIILIPFILLYGWIVLFPYKLDKNQLETKQYVSIDQIPKKMQEAIIETEDARFYHHFGIDPIGIVRVFYRGIRDGELKEGASTITQQVARNTFLTQEKTAKRKIKEIFIALNLDYHYSKKQLLEYYLNMVYLGNNSYGIAEASQKYFGKDLNELSTDEIALLTGLPQAPSAYDPTVNKTLAIERRNIVLGIMYKKGIISKLEYNEDVKKPITIK